MESGQERKVKGKRKKVERMLQKERSRQTAVREWKKRTRARNKDEKERQGRDRKTMETECRERERKKR